jgi:hypothetical protein
VVRVCCDQRFRVLTPEFVVSTVYLYKVCRVQGLHFQKFVVSRVCRVQVLSCPGFVVSRVCLV